MSADHQLTEVIYRGDGDTTAFPAAGPPLLSDQGEQAGAPPVPQPHSHRLRGLAATLGYTAAIAAELTVIAVCGAVLYAVLPYLLGG